MTAFNEHLTVARWRSFSLYEQLANVGSEVHRAIAWREADPGRSAAAADSAIELIDLTIEDPKNRTPALKEICRARELLADYLYGSNDYSSTDQQWESYFHTFACLASKY